MKNKSYRVKNIARTRFTTKFSGTFFIVGYVASIGINLDCWAIGYVASTGINLDCAGP